MKRSLNLLLALLAAAAPGAVFADRVEKHLTASAGQTLEIDLRTGGGITVRLVRTSDGQPIWAEQFDEQATDVFKLQDSISEKVTSALALDVPVMRMRAV